MMPTSLGLDSQKHGQRLRPQPSQIDPAIVGENEVVVIEIGAGEFVRNLAIAQGDRLSVVPERVAIIVNKEELMLIDARSVLAVIENSQPEDTVTLS